ncbi:hypothetical protein J6590_017810 [Homalodisca vitripennis]|nr:hypothetical protein J6590_017810 [Homalodisca vitripennis]
MESLHDHIEYFTQQNAFVSESLLLKCKVGGAWQGGRERERRHTRRFVISGRRGLSNQYLITMMRLQSRSHCYVMSDVTSHRCALLSAAGEACLINI